MTGLGTTGGSGFADPTADGGAGRRGRAWRALPRRAAGGLRGWGGVGAMAGACALALAGTAALIYGPAGGPAAVPGTGPGAAVARQAAATSCTAANAAQSLRPSAAAGPAVRRIQARGELVVGVDQSNYLWGYRDPATGDLKGFDIDLVRAIATDLLGPDPHIVFRAVTTKDRFTDLANGSVDMVVRTVSIACSRMGQAAFSTAYFEAGQQMLVPRDDDTIHGYDASIRGKRVCVAEKSSAQAQLKENGFGAREVSESNQLDCLVDLQLGMADAVFTDNTQAAGLAAQDPAVHLVGSPVDSQPYGVAMNLHDSDLVRRVNKVLESWRSGGWQQSYDHWLRADLPGIGGPPAPQYKD